MGDPVADIEIIDMELRLKDISMMKGKHQMHQKEEKVTKAKSPQQAKAWEDENLFMERLIKYMEDGNNVRNGLGQWTASEIQYLNEYQLLSAKPCLFAINVNKRLLPKEKQAFE